MRPSRLCEKEFSKIRNDKIFQLKTALPVLRSFLAVPGVRLQRDALLKSFLIHNGPSPLTHMLALKGCPSGLRKRMSTFLEKILAIYLKDLCEMTVACSGVCRPFPPNKLCFIFLNTFGGKGRHNRIPCDCHLVEIF